MSEGRIRAPRVDFTMIGNQALRDDRLSARDLGVYTRAFYYANIPEFKLYKTFLAHECRLGRDAFRASWHVLLELGYVTERKYQIESGRFAYEYDLLIVPEPPKQTEKEADLPEADFPPVALPHVGKHTANNTIQNNTVNNNISDLSADRDLLRDHAEREAENKPEVLPEEIPDSVRKDRRYSEKSIVKAIRKADPAAAAAILKEVRCRFEDRESVSVIFSPWVYYMQILKNAVKDWKPGQTTSAPGLCRTGSGAPGNRFHNFQQREYDFADLEKKLLAATW